MVATATRSKERSKLQRKADPPGKNIVLFSDGTGNSSAKVFKTNVWRMYEAVDLGPSPSGYRDQLSFYDDGVGTSNFKLLAAIGGAFGWGLRRNILDLYRYACRNYEPGDRIYCFGFSRGAFTIRLVVQLIASQGLVSSTDESDLESKSSEAYRAFRREFRPRKFRSATETARKVRDRKSTYRRQDNEHPNIHFVGVWDTVAAYGGPIAEITRAIDNWIYPLSMPDYALHEKVQCARHALAIDDERDAFWPLLWDEVVEEQRAEAARTAQQEALMRAQRARSDKARKLHLKKAADCAARKRKFSTRLQQVWFTGMHADVGGGYPDESLSYVSLLWMMEEAEKRGLRTLESIKDRFFALANSYGPMHNSRSGVGAYYRYQPRKIAAWLDWPRAKDNSRYLMLRDPDVCNDQKKSRGLLRRARIHESVIARINSGTVRYAPIALPESFDVVPPQAEGEKVQQATGSVQLKCKYDRPPSESLITGRIRALATNDGTDRFARQEKLWDVVWWRRFTYFATVAVTFLFVLLPLWNPLPSFVDSTCSDSRCVLPSLFRPMKALVPGFAEPWIEAMARYPITPLVLGSLIAALLWESGRLERRLYDRSFHLWRRVFDDKPIGPPKKNRFRTFREGPGYQTFFRWLKWRFLPAAVGIVMVMAILYLPFIAVTQIMIQIGEADHSFCAVGDPKMLRTFDRATFDFDTGQPCRRPGLILEKGQVYEIAFQLPVTEKGEPVGWWDDDVASKPGSLTRVRASGLFQIFGVPLRRVIEASYLQPLVQTADRKSEARPSRVHITELDLKPDEEWPELYRARLKASEDRDTSLHLFANDAYIFFLGQRWTYGNNCGTARVVITKVARRGKGFPLMTTPREAVPVPQCAKDKLKTKSKAPQAS